MEIVLDTETSGFRENRLVQLSFELSHESRIIHEATLLIRPDGWEIEEGATAVHGITTADAAGAGVPVSVALHLLHSMLILEPVLVCHNTPFDLDRVLIPEFKRLPNVDFPWFKLATFCTMEAMRPICRLPMKGSGWKAPKLSEAYLHAFGEELQNAHRADVDRKACARLYRWLRDGACAESQPCGFVRLTDSCTGSARFYSYTDRVAGDFIGLRVVSQEREAELMVLAQPDNNTLRGQTIILPVNPLESAKSENISPDAR